MDLPKKIREIRGELTQEEFAKLFGVSTNTIQNYERAKTSPPLDFLLKIAERFGVPIWYFLDLPYNKEAKTPCVKTSTQPAEIIKIPYHANLSVSAGFGALNESSARGEVREFTRSFLRGTFNITNNYDKTFIVRSFGNSMTPTIPESCMLIAQNVSIQDGEIGIFRIGGEFYVKRLTKLPRLRLVSDNPIYEPIVITEEMEFEVLGRVMGFFLYNRI